ncbi:NrfD/PsrC family molybdoenzyme membrane anchor subunit [Gordonia sp. NPDC062954]|uniref:NrfD/PsrC family molybdoenzyme membrane anchor subunit n=1 Tax=unclassified Gordonia (in: high G+C Gram-positive bacteria) TaxID=2657482 RepID=UPI000C367002|nr:NrfD/PsrC family molybdoenzyme membrane anchor subunit [Gordonia sp. (in: high G+C Gram-positive bacteria)]MAU83478.1 polysulfide reductase [Gordonia sp. (in: high G+C Gram-positive bacteria)]
MTERRTGVPDDTIAPPEREAVTSERPDGGERSAQRKRRRKRGEELMVPDADFQSYYGKPILNGPTWSATDIAGYLFLGGLAGGSSVLAAGAHLTGRPELARSLKIGALGAISGSLVALIHDLGRPERFVNMLRVVKPSSPMSMGSWLLSVYGPAAGVAAVTDLTGWFPRIGTAATTAAAATGPAVAAYTAVLISDTAVPAWHAGHRQMPYLFVGSASMAAGGLGMLAAPVQQAGPARRAVLAGAVVELGMEEIMRRQMGLPGETLHAGRAGRLTRAAQGLGVLAAGLAATAGRRSRAASMLAGAAGLAGSACMRFGIFAAGAQSAHDPKYVVIPQKEGQQRS